MTCKFLYTIQILNLGYITAPTLPTFQKYSSICVWDKVIDEFNKYRVHIFHVDESLFFEVGKSYKLLIVNIVNNLECWGKEQMNDFLRLLLCV